MIWTTLAFDETVEIQTLDGVSTPTKPPIAFPQPQTRGPVYRLNADLLYRIFWINSDMNSESEWAQLNEDPYRFRALITTRHASQVCRRWREILLSSSAVWAKALDLQLLDQNSGHWREEIMRRTGEAPILMKGKVRGHHREVREFFEDVIINHWPRIRALDVEIYHPKMFKSEAWDVLTRPAHILESLKLRFHPHTLLPNALPHGHIFDNIAPSLRELYVEQLFFDPQNSWVQQIRKLIIFPTRHLPLTASQMLEVITHMPLLESLSFGNVLPGETPGRLDAVQNIFLPHLSDIAASEMELKVFVAILGKIKPSPDCVLDVFCAQKLERGFESTSPAEDAYAKMVLTRYIKGHFDNRNVNTLSLRWFCGVFVLEDNISNLDYRGHPTRWRGRFRLSINHYNLNFLFDVFSSCQYPDVTTLEVCLDASDRIKPLPSITAFLQRFPSVKTLTVDRYALHHLNHISEDVFMFYSLREVKTKGRIFLRGSPEERLYDTLVFFLRRASTAGVPVKTVDLTGSNFMGEALSELGQRYIREFGAVVVL